ncbi:hypothetical protein [Streptosporangium saharense]|uniref:hypothetical protein n=1 Tax=Streptosporangium saharense TaxID=1706840 RepID=UPI00369442F7
MLVVLALAALAVIAAVVVVAMGRGGELARFAPDVPPLELPEPRRLGAADFLALQLPVSVVGYNTQSVDETLNRVVKALSERDTRIAVLEQQVAELLAGRLQTRYDAGTAPPVMRDSLAEDAAERPQEDVESGGPVEAEAEEVAEPLRAVQPQEPANQEAEAKQPETTTDTNEPDKDEAEEPGEPEEAVESADKASEDPKAPEVSEGSAEGDRTEVRGVKEVR